MTNNAFIWLIFLEDFFDRFLRYFFGFQMEICRNTFSISNLYTFLQLGTYKILDAGEKFAKTNCVCRQNCM